MDNEPEVPIESHDQHQGHALHFLLLGTALAAGAVILAPYVLPSFGIGSAFLNTKIMAGAMNAATTGGGLAGLINNHVIAAIPFVGSTLAQGGLWTAAAAGVTGLGGLILSHYIAKRKDGSTQIHWSRIIGTAALITSALIALPAALTSLTVGIAFLSSVISGPASGIAALHAFARFGTGVGGMSAASMTGSGAWGGLAALAPHLLTCGSAMVPVVISWFASGKKHSAKMEGDATHSTMNVYAHHPSVDIQKTSSDIITKINVKQPTLAHLPCEATLILSHADGSPLTAQELAISHTQKIHLFVTDQSLKDYHHIHPMPTEIPGVYKFSFSPNTSNHYSAWVDCVTSADGKEHITKTDIASATHRNVMPSIRINSQAEQNGLQFEWKTSGPLCKDTPCIAEVIIKDSNGNPVTDLEPVMGAYAHLVGFSADGNSFSHIHPLDRQPINAEDRGGPCLRFQVMPDTTGKMQYYLHVQHAGQAIYVPFGQQVKSSLTEQLSQPRAAMVMMR